MLMFKTTSEIMLDGEINVTKYDFLNYRNQLLKDLIIETLSELDELRKGSSSESLKVKKVSSRFTGSTGKMGFYMIYNQITQKYYIGSTSELSKRIAYFNRDFREYFRDPNQRRPRLYASFIQDITANNCIDSDFYFIPLFLLDKRHTTFKNLQDLPGFDSNDPYRCLLESIEFKAIEYFKQNLKYRDCMYNTAALGLFQINNTYRPDTSGSPKKAIAETQGPYAWESLSVCAKFLGIDRKTVRNKIDGAQAKNQRFLYLNVEEIQAWDTNYFITSNDTGNIQNRFPNSLIEEIKNRYTN